MTHHLATLEPGFVYGIVGSGPISGAKCPVKPQTSVKGQARGSSPTRELALLAHGVNALNAAGQQFQDWLAPEDMVMDHNIGPALVRYHELAVAQIPLSHRFILDHFISSTSIFLSSHKSFYHRIQKQIIPMALQTPFLFSAVLALACRSALTQGIRSIEGTDTNMLIPYFCSDSTRGLRRALSSPHDREALIATSLLLCLGEIYEGGKHPSWSVHLEGARNLLAAQDSQIGSSTRNPSPSLLLLRHLFQGITVQAALQSDSVPYYDWLSLSSEAGEGTFVDEYLGFDTGLIPIFKAIGQAVHDPRRSGALEGECLLRKLDDIINHSQHHPPRLRPNIQSDTLGTDLNQFSLSNTAYQHAARIHIYRRLLNEPSDSPDIQASVQVILSCVQQMVSGEGLRPWITMVMPIFVAGCEAQDYEYFDFAAAHLAQLETAIGAKNIRRVSEVMKGYQRSSNKLRPSGVSIWSHSIGKLMPVNNEYRTNYSFSQVL